MDKKELQMRNKLIGLIRNAPTIEYKKGGRSNEKTFQMIIGNTIENVVGHLLENGVTVPLYSVGDKVWYCDKNIDVITTAVIEQLCNKKRTYIYLIRTVYGVCYYVNEDELYSTLVQAEEDLKGL